MARNRKNDSALRVAPVLATVALCALFAGLGVGYVWYKDQISVLGHQIKDREQTLAKLQGENKSRREQLDTLCSPKILDETVKKLNLGLGPTALSQVIRLVDAQNYEQAVQPPPPSEPQRPVKMALATRKN
jgi:capsular polysaccharide biosynthesis protein